MAPLSKYLYGFVCCLCLLVGCATTPPPTPKVLNLGWYGEKLPPGMKQRLKALPGEPPLRKKDGRVTEDPREAKEYIRLRDRAVMVYLPKGHFLLGAHKWEGAAQKWEKPQLKVLLKSYYMDKYEVSQSQFEAFVEATRYKTQAEKKGKSLNWNGVKWAWIKGLSWQNPWPSELKFSSEKNHPVLHISYGDAQAYAQWAGSDLPTEAQWERAARGEDGRPFPWGQGPAGTQSRYPANYTPGRSWKYLDLDGARYTAPVDGFPEGVSPVGCFNMSGNAWEWCRDYWDPLFYKHLQDSAAKDPGALKNPFNGKPSQERVVRGGGWTPTHRDHRTTSRGKNIPTYTAGDLGFRCMVEGVE